MLKIKFEKPQKRPKAGLRLSTSFDQNNMGPSQKGSFWPYLSPVELDLKFKKIDLPYRRIIDKTLFLMIIIIKKVNLCLV